MTFRISTIFVTIILLGALVTGIYTFMGDLADSNNLNVDMNDSYRSTFDRIQNVTNEMNESYEEIQDFSANKGSAIQIITLVPDVLILAKNMVALPFTIAYGLTGDVIELMRLPAWVATVVFTLIIGSIVFALIALILRYRYT